MPADERSTRSGERCDQHPTRSAVARCDGCGRPLCLSCAVPVRGRVLGAECLPEPLVAGPDPETRGRIPLTPTNLVTGAAFALAWVGTALPWSRFGVGSGPFGAWGDSPRWALLAAAAALAGTAVWVARQLVRNGTRPGYDVALAVAGAVLAIASALAIWRPPAFTRPSLGPWVSLVAGLVACGAALTALRRARNAAAVRV